MGACSSLPLFGSPFSRPGRTGARMSLPLWPARWRRMAACRWQRLNLSDLSSMGPSPSWTSSLWAVLRQRALPRSTFHPAARPRPPMRQAPAGQASKQPCPMQTEPHASGQAAGRSPLQLPAKPCSAWSTWCASRTTGDLEQQQKTSQPPPEGPPRLPPPRRCGASRANHPGRSSTPRRRRRRHRLLRGSSTCLRRSPGTTRCRSGSSWSL
jgi:hypothetical protein